MFIQHPKFIQLMKDKYGYSDAEIAKLFQDYSSTVTRLMLLETIGFIEEHKSENYFKIQKLLESKKGYRGQIETEIEIMEAIFNLINEDTAVREHVLSKIEELDTNLTHDLIEDLNEEEQLQLLNIIKDDLEMMERVQKKLEE